MTLIPRRVRAQVLSLRERATASGRRNGRAGAATETARAGTPAAYDVYALGELIRATAHALHATGMVEGIHTFAVARALHAAGLLADPRNTP